MSRFRLMPKGYRHPVYLDARGDWTRIVGRLFWLRRRCRHVVGVDMAGGPDASFITVLRVNDDGTLAIVDFRKVA